MSELCKECGGDPVIAEIARRMGHRPDIAYAHVMRLEQEKQALKQRLIDVFHEYSVAFGEQPSYEDACQIIN